MLPRFSMVPVLCGGVICALATPIPAGAQDGGPTPQGSGALSSLRDRWISAYEAGDAEAMSNLYAERAVRMPYDAPSAKGRGAIVAEYRKQFGSRSLYPTIRLLPDDVMIENRTAIERGRYDEILTSGDGLTRIRERGKYVSIAERGSDGRWRYVISIFNRDGPPERN